MSREQWESLQFRPRKNLIELLKQDAKELAGDSRRVLLCFFGDPYSPEAAASGVTRQALEILREHNISFQVLTKGGTRAVPDFDLYGPYDAFATTMTFVGATDSQEYEPGAALPSDRMEAIYRAKAMGIETWVSLEPVIHPSEALYWIGRLSSRVDLFKVGKLNHDKAHEKEIDWRGFGIEAILLLEKLRKPYYIKDGLAKYLEGVTFTNTDTRTVTRQENPHA